MQILFISGFLGAGKTSFIRSMQEATGRQFVIVENEFGEVGVDGPLLQSDRQGSLDDLKVWEMTEGCICCSTNLDFSQSILTIANTLNPDILLVEPSGVALPSRLLEKIRPICYERISLLAPVTILDAEHYRESRKDFPLYFNDQLSAAGTIVLSKSEHLTEEDFLRIRRESGFSEEIDYPLQHYSTWPKEMWTELLEKELVWETDDTDEAGETSLPESLNEKNVSARAPLPGRRAYKIRRKQKPREESMESIGSINPHIPGVDALVFLLELMIHGAFGRIVRSKGYFPTSAGWVRFDLVDGSYSITGCEDMEEGRVVVIGKNLKKDLLREAFPSEQ